MSDGVRLLGGSLTLSAYPFSVSADRAGQPYLVRLGQHAVLPLPRYNYVVTRSRPYLETKGHVQGQGPFPMLRGSGRRSGRLVPAAVPVSVPRS